MMTKCGYGHVFDVETGMGIYAVYVSTIFLTAEQNATSGMLGVDRSGQVRSLIIDCQLLKSTLA